MIKKLVAVSSNLTAMVLLLVMLLSSTTANQSTGSAIPSPNSSGQDRPTQKLSGVSPEDEQSVRKMLIERREAGNRHDMKTFCSYFADDADFVNVAGSWWKGRQEIEKNMTELYAPIFKDIHFNDSEIKIRFITPDVAVEHFKWEATGIVGLDGSPRPPRQGIGTVIAAKIDGKWQVTVFNNNEFTASIARRLAVSKETTAKQ